MQKILLAILLFSLSKSFGQTTQPKLKIAHLTDNFYIYTTYGNYENTKVPANGMYLVTSEGVILFDTPWDTTQFQPLLDSIQFKHHKTVNICIATHWHDDRTAGLEYYRQKGIKTYTTKLTDELSKKNNNKRAENIINKDTTFHVGNYSFETYYPGPGHTIDNIVIGFNKEKILYGGCLIKGVDAKNLGFLGDADTKAYYNTLKNVEKKYPAPKYIIVSHSDWDNVNSLKHSINLAKKLKEKN
ncbi:BlaB/IND/MUS family subclass B1 metallo-beta-lactamase [Nubsella zeaxanthinifaciens]|uniref:BlaB/IND/MUS family subclass B1 metallo-beta-lactamase n=1 Tax=Nubsella zeaxanthinifaciens TaxID=392412 RepID=UPI000DE4510E|nr:BlaB/IND/MUS family subclass B1 metallo-beta-lactamase [Nubsella zeaxanthinifaciens]